MKLSRDDLKNIVKECLVEILSEGLTQTSVQINESRATQRQDRQVVQKPMPARSGVADKISFLPRAAENPAPRKPSIDRNAIKTATSDPLLQEMLADTAARGPVISDDSRMSQMMQESAISVQGDVAAKAMLRSDPTDIFGDAASKWATLAFTEKKIGI